MVLDGQLHDHTLTFTNTLIPDNPEKPLIPDNPDNPDNPHQPDKPVTPSDNTVVPATGDDGARQTALFAAILLSGGVGILLRKASFARTVRKKVLDK
jgi:LPXTG-motif cell wall-anchored protein